MVISDKLKITNSLNDSLSGLFDGDPVILPFPNDAPPEIPRILLKSKDEQYNLQITMNRIDFIHRYPKDVKIERYPVPDLYEKFVSIHKNLADINVEFNRAAVVTNWIIESDSPGALLLQAKYIQERVPFEDPSKIEVHCLTKETVAGCESNKWVRIKSAHKISAPEQNQFLLLVIDINTMAEKPRQFDKALLNKFLSDCTEITNQTKEVHLKEIRE